MELLVERPPCVEQLSCDGVRFRRLIRWHDFDFDLVREQRLPSDFFDFDLCGVLSLLLFLVI